MMKFGKLKWLHYMIFKALCILCGSDDHVIISRKGRLKIGKGFKIQNVVCKKCSLIYNWPQLSVSEAEQFYTKAYLKEQYNLKNHKDVEKRLILRNDHERARKRAAFFNDFIKDKTVLEVGCSYGTLLATVRDHYGARKVFGIEPNDLAVSFAKSFYALEIFHGTLDAYSLIYRDQPTFDLIILSHIFEHFVDPINALQLLKNMLKNEGVIFIEIPNISQKMIGLYKPTALFFEPGHYFTYFPKTIHLMLEKAGFKIIKYDNCNDARAVNMRFIIAKECHPATGIQSFPDLNYKEITRKIYINNIRHLFSGPYIKIKSSLNSFLSRINKFQANKDHCY